MIGAVRRHALPLGSTTRPCRAAVAALVALSVCAASCGGDTQTRGSADTSASSQGESTDGGEAPDSTEAASDPFVADGPRAQLLGDLVEDTTLNDSQRTCIAAAIESFSDQELDVITAAAQATEPNFGDPTFAKWVEASMGCMNAGASLADQVKNRSNLVLDEVQEACVDGYLGELTDEELQALIDAPDNPYNTELVPCLEL
jgi:hypothetical protein